MHFPLIALFLALPIGTASAESISLLGLWEASVEDDHQLTNRQQQWVFSKGGVLVVESKGKLKENAKRPQEKYWRSNEGGHLFYIQEFSYSVSGSNVSIGYGSSLINHLLQLKSSNSITLIGDGLAPVQLHRIPKRSFEVPAHLKPLK